MKYVFVIIATIAFMSAVTPVKSQDGHPCDPYAPYYTHTQTGPGAMLADIFFFVGSIPHTVVLVGGPNRPVVNTRTREVRRVSTAACMPITTARHFGQTRPPHVEHWRAE